MLGNGTEIDFAEEEQNFTKIFEGEVPGVVKAFSSFFFLLLETPCTVCTVHKSPDDMSVYKYIFRTKG